MILANAGKNLAVPVADRLVSFPEIENIRHAHILTFQRAKTASAATSMLA
jgi:hypothetical protein